MYVYVCICMYMESILESIFLCNIMQTTSRVSKSSCICVYVCVCVYVYEYVYVYVYGAATISRLLKIIGLFRRIPSLL